MLFSLNKLVSLITINSALFLMLMISIQNSSKKSKVNLIFNETVKVPVSFIIGTSFIGGSIIGGFLSLDLKSKKDT